MNTFGVATSKPSQLFKCCNVFIGAKKYLYCLTIFFILATSLVACQKEQPAYHEQFLAFGTLIEVKIWGIDPDDSAALIKEIEGDFNYMNLVWHAWRPGPVGRINSLLITQTEFSVAPSVRPLIIKSTELSQKSNGLFNPALGALMKIWGFHSSKPPKGPPPSAENIKLVLDQNPQMSDIKMDGIKTHGTNKAVQLDFGGFAKGVAVDFAIELLKERGVKNAIINAGGDLRAIGQHGSRPWRIGIRNPRGEGVLASVDTQDNESIFTSGDYERYFNYEGIRYHHIIDPRTGYPARGTTSVTVFDNDAGRADAAATALFVAGPEDWYTIAQQMGVQGVMLVDSQGKIHLTPNLKDRIYFQQEPKPDIIYSKPL